MAEKQETQQMAPFKQRLLAAQMAIKALERNAENSHFRNSYVDINGILAEVKPILNKHGIILTQAIGVIDGRNVLSTKLADAFSDASEASTAILPEVADPQKFGSALTYFRRYSLLSILALEAEDDDAETAVGRPPAAGASGSAPAGARPFRP